MMTFLSVQLSLLNIFLVNSGVPPCNANVLNKTSVCDICNCFKHLVDCSFKNLSEIPRDIKPTVKILNMTSTVLNNIKDFELEHLTELTVLDLYNTSLNVSNFTNNTFYGLKNIKVLNISHNYRLAFTRKTTPTDIFAPLVSLQVLRMYGTTSSYDNIEAGYPDVQLSRMKNLTELWIDAQYNINFGVAFRNMTSLKILRLPGDNIQPPWRSKEFCSTNIPASMLDNLISISHLYIRKCNVSIVDERAFLHLINLEFLDLSKNMFLTLAGVSKAFGSLQNKTSVLVLNSIENLYDSERPGVVLTKEMVECLQYTPLKELHIDHNRLQSVQWNVFESLPPTLEIISAKRNGLYMGYYVFFMKYLINVRTIDVSYQFFFNDINFWKRPKSSNTLSDLYETESQYKLFRSGECLNKRQLQKMDRLFKSELSVIRDNVLVDFRTTDLISDDKNFRIEKSAITLATTENGVNIEENQDETHEKQSRANEAPKVQSQFSTIELEKDYGKYQMFCPRTGQFELLPPGSVVGYIPKHLKYLDLSHSKHGFPVLQFDFNENNSLEIINASNSLLYCWEGPVRGLNSLKYLDLSSNLCDMISNHFFKYTSRLEVLNIGRNFLGATIRNDTGGNIFQYLTALKYLDISENYIKFIPKLVFKAQKNLEKLILDRNHIEDFTIKVRHMTKLRNIELYFNKITTLSKQMMNDLEDISSFRILDVNKSNQLIINLRNNPIHCYCNNIEFLEWISDHSNINQNLRILVSKCVDENGQWTSLSRESNNTIQTILLEIKTRCNTYTEIIIGVSLALAILVNILIGVIVHRFRWKLQYWWFVANDSGKWCETQKRKQYSTIVDNYIFDVFVASSEEINEFVIDKFRPQLKKEHLVAFIPVYHINFNENRACMIGQAINRSRVVLFILSDEWTSDPGMEIALHMWQCDMVRRKRQSVLVIYTHNLTGNDARKVEEIFSDVFIDYPGEADCDEEDTFWRLCFQYIRDLAK